MHLLRERTISRRTVLRGIGAMLALPWLEIMAAPFKAKAPPLRSVFMFVPGGVNHDEWLPKSAGANYQPGKTLAALAPVREHVVVLSGLNARHGEVGANGHPLGTAPWLSSAPINDKDRGGYCTDISVDQLIANHVGQDTRLPSLELGCDADSRNMGFWLNGGGVDVVDNVSAGQAHSGFHVFARPLSFRLDDTYRVTFPAASLKDRSWIAPRADMDISNVPIRFTGNTAYVLASSKHRGVGGFVIDNVGIHARERHPNLPPSQFHDLLSWNARGIKTSYTRNMHFKNVRVLGDYRGADDAGINLRTQGGNSDLLKNLQVIGFGRGLVSPARSEIRSGTFMTALGMHIPSGQGIIVDVAGVKFVPLPFLPGGADRRATGSAGRPLFDLYRDPIFTGEGGFRPDVAFGPQPVEVRGHPQLADGKAELYSLEQMPDYVLPDLGVPGLLDGKTTTREAWERYRLAPGGAVAPPDAAPPGLRSNGVFGLPARYDTTRSYRDSATDLAGFRPQVQRRAVEKRKAAVAAPPTDLKPGWNLLSLDVDGVARTALIHGGPIPSRPRVDAGPDQAVSVGDGARLAGIGPNAASLRWSRAFGPEPVVFEDDAAAQTRARFGAPGTYVLHLTAPDEDAGTNTDSVLVSVEAALP